MSGYKHETNRINVGDEVTKARLINMPVFMDAQNLQPFISQVLKAMINKVDFEDKNGEKQVISNSKIRKLIKPIFRRAELEILNNLK